ncbi:MAG: hypothetical protein E7208_02645 [Clostridium butyricum]|nr:hypothetical protein [Clostridium butyricum]
MYANKKNNMGCNDIFGGFQKLHPRLFNVISEIFGNMLSGSLPFNVQNALGNWLEFIGEVIVVHAAQQQYFQSGPGMYYDNRNYNVTNPFCSSSQENESREYNNSNEEKIELNKMSHDEDIESEEINKEEQFLVNELYLEINKLEAEINEIKNKLGNL